VKPQPVAGSIASEFLPHRVPFLFADRVISIDSDGARIVRAVTRNDALLRGSPVLPATLIVEAMAQAAGVLIVGSYQTHGAGALIGIDDFVFHGPVRAGERLVLEVKVRRVRSPFYLVTGRALVDEDVRAEGQITVSTEAPRPRRRPTRPRARGGVSADAETGE
jgi:3-hydroxyacyl-[acyl-carrier-protein] dehydratase